VIIEKNRLPLNIPYAHDGIIRTGSAGLIATGSPRSDVSLRMSLLIFDCKGTKNRRNSQNIWELFQRLKCLWMNILYHPKRKKIPSHKASARFSATAGLSASIIHGIPRQEFPRKRFRNNKIKDLTLYFSPK